MNSNFTTWRNKMLFLCCFLLFSCNDRSKKSQNIKSELHIYSDNIKSPISALVDENNEINPVIFDTDNNEHSLSEFIDTQPKLIFLFSEVDCSFCLDHSMDYIQKYTEKIGVNNILILGRFLNHHSFINFKKKYKTYYAYDLKNKVYDLKTYEEMDNSPHFFILDSKLQAKRVFIPLKSNPERTNRYFKKLAYEVNFQAHE